MKTKFLFFLVILLCTVIACKEDQDEITWNQDTETTTDTDSATEGELDSDTDSDGETDGGAEADSDGGVDGGMEVDGEMDTDGEMDSDSDSDGGELEEPLVDLDDYDPDVTLITGSVMGYIFDENDNPIANATVRLRETSYTTDEYGNFFADNVDLNREGTFYTVRKSGYVEGSRRFFPQANTLSYTRVQLLTSNSAGSFDSAAGGTINGPNGLEITFPADGIVNANGAPYSGNVQVNASWLDPSSDNVGDQMPGGLQGVNSDLEEVALSSFSMASIDLRGGGSELNLAPGSKATINFPVPSDLLGNAPSEIALWSFDDEQFGIWVEEGVATLQGNQYVGEVTHFSFWNCDAPFPIVYITGVLEASPGVPIPNQSIKVSIPGTSICRYGQTDQNGVFAGKMPKDELLAFNVNECTGASSTFGPYSVDTDLGPINILDSSETVTVTGSVVDCSGGMVSNGLVSTSFDGVSQSYSLNGSGNFEYGVVTCGSTNDVSVVATDLTNFVQSDPVSLTYSDFIDTGAISACGNVVDFFAAVTINGVTTNFVENDLSGFVEAGVAFQFFGQNTQNDDGGYIDFGSYDGTNWDIGVGSFDASVVNSIDIFLSDAFISCSQNSPCSDLELTLNEFQVVQGADDNIVAGTIEGTTDGNGDSFMISFRVPIQF